MRYAIPRDTTRGRFIPSPMFYYPFDPSVANAMLTNSEYYILPLRFAIYLIYSFDARVAEFYFSKQ